MEHWLADEEAAAVAVGGVHRLAARIGFALRLARAESVDQAFLAPLGSALALIGQAVRPTAASPPAVALLRARPEVQVATSFLAALASRGSGRPTSCSGISVSEDPLVASDPWARPPAAKGKGKGILRKLPPVAGMEGHGQCSVSLSVGERMEAPGADAPAGRPFGQGPPFEAVLSASGKGNVFKRQTVMGLQEGDEVEQVSLQDSLRETVVKRTEVVVDGFVGNDFEEDLVPGFSQGSARAGCKEVVGKLFKQDKVEQVLVQDSLQETAVKSTEVVVGGFVGKNIEEDLVPDFTQGSARAECKEVVGKLFKQVKAEQALVQDSLQETAGESTEVVVGEFVGKDIEEDVEPDSMQGSARAGCKEFVGKLVKQFEQVRVQDSLQGTAGERTEVVEGEFVGKNIEEDMVPDSMQGSARADRKEFVGKLVKQVKVVQFRVQDLLQKTAGKRTGIEVVVDEYDPALAQIERRLKRATTQEAKAWHLSHLRYYKEGLIRVKREELEEAEEATAEAAFVAARAQARIRMEREEMEEAEEEAEEAARQATS